MPIPKRNFKDWMCENCVIYNNTYITNNTNKIQII